MINTLSLVAYFGVQPRIGKCQRDVLNAIMELGIATDREVCNHLKWEINRITNRRGELLKKHLIVSVGIKKNEYGNLVETWRPNPNYRIDVNPRTIDRLNLGKAQFSLPLSNVVYMVNGKILGSDGKLH